MSEALARLLFRYRWWLTGFILIGAVVLAPRANITSIDNDLTAWFSKDDPVYREYVRFRNEFGGTRSLIIAVQAPSRDRLFSPDGLAYLDAVTSAIERLHTVEWVSSLANATAIDARPSTHPDEGPVLDVRRLFDDLGASPSAATAAAVGRRAIGDDLMREDLVSADGTVAAVIAFFDEERVDAMRAQVLGEVRTIVDRNRPADFRTFFNGSLEISETYNRVTLANQTTFTPPIVLLTVVAIFLMFRSWRRTLLTLGAVLVSVIWTLGLYDLMGFNFNVLSSMILPLIVVLAIADDVHIIQHYGEARREGSAEHAFVSTVSHLVAPLLGASGTTALGMASLATSNVVAVREFGLGSAVGVMLDFAISLVLMPTLLGWLKPETRIAPQETLFTRPMLWIARLSITRARRVMVVATIVTAVATAGLLKLRVDTNHINFFGKGHPIVESANVIDGKLGGIYAFQVFVEGPPESLRTPDALNRMDRLEAELRGLPGVRKVTGAVDYVRRIHRELGERGSTAIPEDPAVVAQELLVFSLSDQGRVELGRVATSDFSKAQITVKLASQSSGQVFDSVEKAEAMAARAFDGSGLRPTVTGSGRLFSTLDGYLVTSQVSSFTTAFITVFGVIFLVFRSWRFGVLAIVPNLFPVLAIFGVMGWMDISLNIATVMLASVALGVVDDDTIHFISRYRRETGAGKSTDEAIEIATEHEGRASLTTAIVNGASFGVLMVSEYKPTAWFGGLLGLTMVVAFLAEVFILPATIKLLPRLFDADRVRAPRVGREL